MDKVEKPLVSKGDGLPYLAIVPGRSIKYPWVFLLATLVEQNLFGLIITGLTIGYGGRYLERAWGSKEFAKFMLFIAMIPNLITWMIYLFFFVVSSSGKAINTTISGGIAIQIGFLVAFKQLVPEHTVSIAKDMIRMRVKHFPAIFLLANTLSGIIVGTETAMILSWFGFFTAWVYLRFYRISPSVFWPATGDGSLVKGDASDTFAFAHFFPEPIHTPVAKFSEGMYNTLIALRVCTPFSAEDIDAGNEQASARAEGGLPSIMNRHGSRGGATRAEAERRRALALKALDQRLHAAAGRPQPAPAAPAAPASSKMLGETTYKPERHDEPHNGDNANS